MFATLAHASPRSPCPLTHTLPTACVRQVLRVSGAGADEVNGGYKLHPAPRLAETEAALAMARAAREKAERKTEGMRRDPELRMMFRQGTYVRHEGREAKLVDAPDANLEVQLR